MQLICELTEAIKYMKRNKSYATYYWILGRDTDNNDWAIVLGWADGFDVTESDDCTDGTWRLCVKLAYQPWNSVCQCDYDVDWLMPYDEETGEVDDMEVSIYPNTNITETVNWLIGRYESYVN